MKKHKIYRSAVTGEFISKDEAEANPRESVSETVTTRETGGSDNKEDGEGETTDSVAE